MNRHKGNTLLVRDADRFGRQIKVANKAKNEKKIKRKSGRQAGKVCGACWARGKGM